MKISASSGGSQRRRRCGILRVNEGEKRGKKERWRDYYKKGVVGGGGALMNIMTRIIFVIPRPPLGSGPIQRNTRRGASTRGVNNGGVLGEV